MAFVLLRFGGGGSGSGDSLSQLLSSFVSVSELRVPGSFWGGLRRFDIRGVDAFGRRSSEVDRVPCLVS